MTMWEVRLMPSVQVSRSAYMMPWAVKVGSAVGGGWGLLLSLGGGARRGCSLPRAEQVDARDPSAVVVLPLWGPT